MDEYSELAYENLDWVVRDNTTSEVDFMNKWSKTVADKFGLAQDEILNLFTSNDTHNSNERVREMWKYSTSIGVNGTPTAFVNGVKMASIPWTSDDWEALYQQLIAPQ